MCEKVNRDMLGTNEDTKIGNMIPQHPPHLPPQHNHHPNMPHPSLMGYHRRHRHPTIHASVQPLGEGLPPRSQSIPPPMSSQGLYPGKSNPIPPMVDVSSHPVEHQKDDEKPGRHGGVKQEGLDKDVLEKNQREGCQPGTSAITNDSAVVSISVALEFNLHVLEKLMGIS